MPGFDRSIFSGALLRGILNCGNLGSDQNADDSSTKGQAFVTVWSRLAGAGEVGGKKLFLGGLRKKGPGPACGKVNLVCLESSGAAEL